VARHPLLALGAVLFGLALGGLLVAASGIVPIKASSRHWPVTQWFLQFSKQRSVATHAYGIETPPLDDRALVLRAAAHYDLGCRPCHGAPGDDPPRIAQAMTPRPPMLSDRVPVWRPRELFYIVKHGLKLTGMPAWTAQERDDEVWAMVAFLQTVPRLEYAEYEAMVRTPASGSAPPIVATNCGRCHESGGPPRASAAFPKLSGQRADYLDRALRAYADGRRHSGIMGPIAADLTASARAEAVGFYSSQPPPEPTAAPDTERASRGHAIATRGIATQDVPACVECHGPAGPPRNPAYPRLAAQYPAYLAQQLGLLQQRRRGGSEYVDLMHSFVSRLTPAQIEDVATYYGSAR
jgi:cytochrome c553